MRALATTSCLLSWLALAAQCQTISAAEYFEPTSAYPHGVLGDAQEWSQLQITVSRKSGKEGGLFSGHLDLTYHIAASPDTVFEDIEPRLWDVTGDGAPEVVVIESHQSYGARLLVIGLVDRKPEYLAATPHIGTRFRWLAPVGAADLDNDGNIEIAFVDRPHLAKTLRIWRYDGSSFAEIAAFSGFSNHRIGEDFISGGLRDCGTRPELILADQDWSRIVSVAYSGDWIKTDLGPFTGPDSIAAARAC